VTETVAVDVYVV